MKITPVPDGEYLKEVFDYVDGQLIGRSRPRHHFKTDKSWRSWNAKFSGKRVGRTMLGGTYRQVMVDCVRYLEHRIIASMHGLDMDAVIDHIDGNGLNNVVSNLRPATQQQNCGNRLGWRKKESRVGVWQKPNGRWIAYIRAHGVFHYLGTFLVYEDAVRARIEKEKLLLGEFAYSSRVAG